jgi:HK97 gp10 family phage protein
MSSSDMAKLAADLQAVAPQAQSLAEQVVTKAAADITAGAQSLAPVDTGALRNSIGYENTSSGEEASAEVGPTVTYAGYVENGTSRMRAQPYLRPATDQVEPSFTAAAEQIAGKVL